MTAALIFAAIAFVVVFGGGMWIDWKERREEQRRFNAGEWCPICAADGRPQAKHCCVELKRWRNGGEG